MSSRTGTCVGPAGIASVATLAILAACGPSEQATAYAPGLGEIMTLTQMRHAKLWWAGHAANWALASYELDELEEGFRDAVTFHPEHKASPVPIAKAVPEMTGEPLRELRAAVAHADAGGFERAYDALTRACNLCHEATEFGFNVVTRPSEDTFSNQDFAAPR
ncbi:MAG: hypothetical protein R3F30_00650 [Planctomycetota bacterium]